MGETEFMELCDHFRAELKDVARQVKSLLEHSRFTQEALANENRSEMKANIMLAYRHLEDARMRIGKVIQAADGGVSVYDK